MDERELVSRIIAAVERAIPDGAPGMMPDPDAVLDSEALLASDTLMNWYLRHPQVKGNPRTFLAMATLHWMRYQILPKDQAERDLLTALLLCRTMHAYDPAFLSDPLRRFAEEGEERLAELRVDVLSDAARERMDRDGDPKGRLAALGEAESLLESAMVHAGPYPLLKADLSGRLGYLWGLRFRCTGSPEDIDTSERWHRRAVEAVDGLDGQGEERARHLSGWAESLCERHESFSRTDDADQGISALREVVRLLPADHTFRNISLVKLAHALLSRFEQTERESDLLDAWTTIHEALDTSTGRPSQRIGAMELSCLSRAAVLRYAHSDDRTLLHQAVHAAREAIVLTAPDDVDFPERQSRLGVALGLRFDVLGDPADLDDLVGAARAAFACPDVGRARSLRYRIGLAQALGRSYQHSGRSEQAEEAIELCRSAAAELAPGDARYRVVLNTLAGTLSRRFGRSGDIDDLEAAVEAAFEAAATAPPGSSERALMLGNLQTVLATRYRFTLEDRDLEEALQAAEELWASRALAPAYRTAMAINLAQLLAARFGDTGTSQSGTRDLDRAVELLRQVLAWTSPGDLARSHAQLDLAGNLMARSAPSGGEADLAEALAVCRDAMAHLRDGDPFRGRLLSRYSDVLLMKFRAGGQKSDLDEAIALERQAAEADAPPIIVAHGDGRSSLADKLAVRAEHTEEEDQVGEAIRANRLLAEDESLQPWRRMRHARSWTRLAVRSGDDASASAGFAIAVRLLPVLGGRGSSLRTRERHLADWAGMAADAAAHAISAGKAEQAVELLENGRSVLWAQTLRMSDDLSGLQAVAPDLAARLLELRTLVNADEAAQVAAPLGGDFTPYTGRRDRARWAAAWDETVALVRRLPGFESFLEPAGFAELAAAAGPVPVVVVNVSGLRCDALVVADGRVDVVPLPRLALSDVLKLSDAFLTTTTTGSALGMVGSLALRGNITSISAWLWRAVAEPVLSFLGHEAPPPEGEPWPRVCWSPVGPLAFLPLHAAGDGDPGAPAHRTVLDRVVSSYTPTLSALARARAHGSSSASASAGERPSMLAVSLPETPGGAPLPYAAEELDRIRGRLSPAVRVTALVGGEAERETVLAQLDAHHWVHFVCHGSQPMDDPGRGGIQLWDGTLTVREMAALRLPKAQLAYLSACDTAVGGNRLLDEYLHLAAALQIVGYPHVIAAQWRTHDRYAADIADGVYEVLGDVDAGLDVNRAAVALHRAVRALRERFPRQPDIWAPYIHVGT
ncbi:CHAT domain-containing protein [Streptomyces sp. st115]|uniref:CHAT domain-containing protein n=1 Tax=Streptomyces sp. st115 TaxID=1828047 RepID=UPI000BF097E0|nr:CHAT domain-containing protein [Streptomyces sp. st115]